jgi:hypothetical protein
MRQLDRILAAGATTCVMTPWWPTRQPMRRCVRGSNAPHWKYISPAGSTHTKLNILWVAPAVLSQHAGGARVRLLHAAGTRRMLLLPAGYTHHMVTRVCMTRCGSHRLAIEWAPRQLFSATRSDHRERELYCRHRQRRFAWAR